MLTQRPHVALAVPHRLGIAVAVMARIPLLECLTRHSYRESLEKSASPSSRAADEAEEDEGHSAPRPSDAAVSPEELPRAAEGGAGEGSEMTDSSGLRAALQEADSPERSGPAQFNVSLLDWINVQDRPNDVESLVRKCFDSINRVRRARLTLSTMGILACSVQREARK